MSQPDIHFYDFDEFRVDVKNRVLLRNGHPTHVTERPFEVLLFLIENRRREVSKEELMERFWSSPNADISNVDQQIKALRDTLSGKLHRQRYIKTFRRRGFKFMGNVTEVLESAGVHRLNPSSPPAKSEIVNARGLDHRHFLGSPVWWGMALLIAAVGILGIQQIRLSSKGDTKSPKQVISSPADEEDVKRVVKESQFYETLTIYSNPTDFDRERLKMYWLPADQGGKALITLEKIVGSLLKSGRRYGSESKNIQFDFRYVRIYSPRDYAEVGTVEKWYVPTYNADGSRVLDKNVYLGPYAIDYSLRKVNGVWLLEENSTPRPQSSPTAGSPNP